MQRGLADIAAIRATALAAAASAGNPVDVYPVIRDALRALGDRHSSLLDPQAAKRLTIGQRTGFGFDRFRDGIVFVYPGSPAAVAGLRDLDRIVGVNGRPTSSLTVDDANAATLQLRVIHAGETEPVDLGMGRGEYSNVRLPAFHPLGRVGYLEVPSPVGDSDALARYIEAGATAIRESNAAPPCGWVIDLRRNTGGYPFPMFAAIAPVVGDGAFMFQDQLDRRDTWSIANGRVLVNGVPQTGTGNAVVPGTFDPAIAVLVSSATASAGEAAAIAFVGKTSVRTFGEPTIGVTSTNVAYRLVDGAILQITTSYNIDRTGRVYDGPIQPDQQIPVDWAKFGTQGDTMLRAASDWLTQQRSCS